WCILAASSNHSSRFRTHQLWREVSLKRLTVATLLLTAVAIGLSIVPAEAQNRSKSYIVVSRGESTGTSSALTPIQRARGRVVRDLSPMGLISVTSDNPDFAKSVPDALAVAPDMQVDAPRPRIVTGPSLATAKHSVPGPPNAVGGDEFLNLQW